MKLYPIEQAHLESCANLYVAVFNAEPWNEQWETQAVLTRLAEIYHTPGFYGLAAADETGLIGLALGYVEQWQQQRHFYLKEMCIKPQLQHRGVGAALMATLQQDLAARGVDKIYLLTARDGPAEAFYRKCGFYASPKMVIMAKNL
jgi:ribosomal protein S18 acetylase RimI-like enzyme